MKPFCVSCSKFMSVKEIGVDVLTIDNDGDPYQLWHGDEYQCPDCNNTIITGWGRLPYTIRKDKGFSFSLNRAIDDRTIRMEKL